MSEESDNEPQDPMQEVCGYDTNVIDVPAMAERRLRAVNRTFKQTITEEPRRPKPTIKNFEPIKSAEAETTPAPDPTPPTESAESEEATAPERPAPPTPPAPTAEDAPKEEPKKDPLLTTQTSSRIALPRPPSRPSLPKPPPSKSSTNLPTVKPKQETERPRPPTADPNAVNTDTQYLIKKLKSLPKPPGK